MTAYYLVKAANEATFEVRTWGGKSDMLLVHEGPTLPFTPRGLVMLHEKHANRSRPMLWHESEGRFYCIHCGESVNMSDALFQKILAMLSLEKYGPAQVDGESAKVTIAHLVDAFPEGLPPAGYYAMKRDDIEAK